jgi:O-antigen/teichoic acid export membrane protein
LVLTTIAAIVGDFGVPAALVKFISEHQDNKKKVNKFISCGLINAFFIGLTLTFIFFIFSDSIAKVFNMPELAQMLKIVSVIFPFILLNDVFIGIFNGYRWMKKYTFLIIVQRVGFIFIAWFLILLGWDVIATIYAMVLKEIATLIFILILIRNYEIKIQIKGHLAKSKELFGFSKYLFLSFQVGFFNTNLDIFLIGYFLTDEHVGIYAVAVMIARFFLTIPEAISRVVLPMTSEFYKKKYYKKIENALMLIMRYSFIIASILGLLIIFFGKLILRLVFPSHPEFLDAYIPMVILIVGTIVHSIVYSIGGLFIAIGRPDTYLKIVSISTFINFCLNISLIPRYGIVGGALATSTSFFASFILFYVWVKRIEKIDINFTWLITAFPIFLSLVIIFLIGQSILNPYLMVIFLFPIYIIIIFLSKLITQRDIQFVKEIIIKKT